jgi:hypothetical protein
MTALCLALAGSVVAVLPTSSFSLSWTHSVEQVPWVEVYDIENGRLILREARVAGSGAGMEPGTAAEGIKGSWRYRPELPPVHRLTLAGSGLGGDYTLCWLNQCHFLGTVLPVTQGGPVTLSACDDDG